MTKPNRQGHKEHKEEQDAIFIEWRFGFVFCYTGAEHRPELPMRRKKSRVRTGLLLGILIAALAPCAAAQAWTETVLYAFKGGTDGKYPQSTPIMDAQGNLYGTTRLGGPHCGKPGCGTVFKVTPDGQESVLYAFQNSLDGTRPLAGVIMDAVGNLYGTTSQGGSRDCGCGTVFKLTPGGVHTILHAFQSQGDGYVPLAGLTMDGAGNLYGAASEGGAGGITCDGACGTVFKITPAGEYSTIYEFEAGKDGASPRSTPVFDHAGNLYGTTDSGGTTACGDNQGCGTVYRLASDGTETVLHRFRGGHDGRYPNQANLILDGSGNLFGVTEQGGGDGCGGNGCGTIFRIAPDRTETILATFNRAGGPAGPGGIVMAGAGLFYGTAGGGAYRSGDRGCGTVFKFVPGHKPKALYSFTCGKDGADPGAGLLRGHDGTLYGTTVGGGNGFGVVYALHR